jgi:hypothetical protein
MVRMQKEASRPTRLAYVTEDDIALLAADLGAGYFTASQLYDWHVITARQEGRPEPSKKALGMALKEAGLKCSVRRVEGRPARCWLLTRPWERRGKAILEAEKAGTK